MLGTRTLRECRAGTCPSLSLFSLLQVPYETLNKRFRAAQKNIDRETSHVTMVVAELEKTLSSCPAVDSVVSLLDGVVEKLSVLKRKVGAGRQVVLWEDCHRLRDAGPGTWDHRGQAVPGAGGQGRWGCCAR